MATELFHLIEDAAVITCCNGVYRQCKVYRRGYRLFAGVGNGFVRLQGSRLTSVPGMRYEGIDLPPSVSVGKGATGEPILKET